MILHRSSRLENTVSDSVVKDNTSGWFLVFLLTQDERIAFRQDLDGKFADPDEGIYGAMLLFLAFMGKDNLDRVFPLV